MTIEEIAIWATLIMLGLAALAALLFGLRNATYGKMNILASVIVISPAVILIALGFTMESWSQAGVVAMLVMFGLACAAMLFTGLRGFFGMR